MNKYLAYCLAFVVVFTLIKAQLMGTPVKKDPKEEYHKSHLYVTINELDVHVGKEPHSGVIQSKVYYREPVAVKERKSGWVRFTDYIDGAKLGLKDSVAFWVNEEFLSKTQPPEKIQNSALE